MTTTEDRVEPLALLSRDLKRAAASMSASQARYLVDYYYQQQENRKRSDRQTATMAEGGEPHELIQWLARNDGTFERNIQRALDGYSDGHPVGLWSKSIVGIGPVLAAGLLANIDITKAPTVGHIWRFAGLDPTVSWEKKEKRPWNARLKVIAWKIGESFVKVQNNEQDVYGHLMLAYKERITAKNLAGDYAEAATAKLAKFKIGKDTEAYGHYSKGVLPPAHIHARAKRWAVKLFLAHWHHVGYETQYGCPPPKPYILEHNPAHTHIIAPPNWPMK